VIRVTTVLLLGTVALGGVFLTSRILGSLDVEAEWVATRAAIDGPDAYRPILELADERGVQHRPVADREFAAPLSHPGTPGSFLLLGPLMLLPFAVVPVVWALVSVAVVGLGALSLSVWRSAPILPSCLAGLSLALLAMPHSWIHYDLAIFPSALLLAGTFPARPARTAAFSFIVIFGWGPILAGLDVGRAMTLARVGTGLAMATLAARVAPKGRLP
jgi:hypothetical protein